MTFRQASAFVRRWRPILCPEWTITVIRGWHPDHGEGDTAASIDPDGDYLRARLYLGKVVDGNLSKRDQHRVLFHELLHLTLRDYSLAAVEPTKGLGHDGRRLAQETLERYLERTVDRLAEAFVDAGTA